ncbi:MULTISPECIES: glycosyltransferase family 4 protein [Roseobacteraceae]|uniref:D-inositol 3-phosphate glycosyltransferase n=3 Tax=Roseobacteraceae TaxID=2854170 RepID=A0A0U1NNM1_9RHOB|nr:MULTISPECIES: glycosyltransferase family 4 protein [Roseobacteraceae]CRK76335.1 D-inositol 3-phosphate glycosyltransferase [Nereida ignava]CUH61450.1 D-inositol 3-phosphate glycosyltransferase [Thalassobacter stenotrophicus]SFJ79690.1 Glycosyl transferases group 1 [Nereida ignava DSM 16309]SHJ09521.1 Glycosyl transferases group 1 [Thalassobacter stenotrophicus DSM 16310]
MHVLYFHQHFSTPQGSAGTRSYEMAQALIRAGHSVTMVCGSYAQGNTGLSMPFKKGRRRGAVDGIDVIEFALNYGNHMGFVQRLGVFLKFAVGSIGVALREPADVVFATTTPLTAGIPGIFARWLTQKPFVFEVRDLWPELPKAMGVITNPVMLWLMSLLEWASYRSADRLVGLSPGIVEGIAARGVDKSRIAMVPNGCDMDLFSTPEAAWRPDGVQDDQLLAIFTGTHGNANGLESVLNAAAVLKDRGRDDVRIALVGQGREKPKLVADAKERGLDNVLFVDPVPKTKLTGLMAGADLGLQVLRNVPAFYFGTSPNKFFDYISAGLPVLNNYPGWLAGLIGENDCGFAVPPDDPSAFADALIEAAEHRDALRLKGVNARELAQTRFARSELSDDWVQWVTGVAR